MSAFRVLASYLPVSGAADRSAGASVSIFGTPLASGDWVNNYFSKPVSKTSPAEASTQPVAVTATLGANAQTETVWTKTRPVSESFTYDEEGNLTADSLWRYVYDGKNRLKALYSLVHDEQGRRNALIFTYDYLGRRVAKELRPYTGTPQTPVLGEITSRTIFVYSGWALLAEYQYDAAMTNLSLARCFTFGIDISGSLGGAGDIGGLLAIDDRRPNTAGIYLPAFDGNGNLSALANASDGSLVAAYEYDPSGNTLRSSGSYAHQNPFRFAGKYHDLETGLVYYGYRYYSPSLGRFINRDPLGEAGGINLMAHAGNDAINRWDILGLDDDEVVSLPEFEVNETKWHGGSSSGGSFSLRGFSIGGGLFGVVAPFGKNLSGHLVTIADYGVIRMTNPTPSGRYETELVYSYKEIKERLVQEFAAAIKESFAESLASTFENNAALGGDAGSPSLQVAESINSAPKRGDTATIGPIGLGFDWVLGRGIQHRQFQDGDNFTQTFSRSRVIRDARGQIVSALSGWDGKALPSGTFAYRYGGGGVTGALAGTYRYLRDLTMPEALGGNRALAFLGSLNGAWSVTSIDAESRMATVSFQMFENTSGGRSGSRICGLGYVNLNQTYTDAYGNAQAGLPSVQSMVSGFFRISSG